MLHYGIVDISTIPMYGASLGRMPMNVVYRLSEPDDRTM